MAQKKALIKILSSFLGGAKGRRRNLLIGRFERFPGQSSTVDKIKLRVFRFDGGANAELYSVGEKLDFSLALSVDGKYDVSGIVENDAQYETKAVRVVVKNGKIAGNRSLVLPFIYTIYD